MGQPFASLACNGVKDLETRTLAAHNLGVAPSRDLACRHLYSGGWDMLANVEGQRVGIFVSKEDWPSDPHQRERLTRDAISLTKAAGYADAQAMTVLPESFQRGQVVALVSVGATRLLTPELVEELGGWEAVERRASLTRATMQQKRSLYVTELHDATWLAHPVSVRLQHRCSVTSGPRPALPRPDRRLLPCAPSTAKRPSPTQARPHDLPRQNPAERHRRRQQALASRSVLRTGGLCATPHRLEAGRRRLHPRGCCGDASGYSCGGGGDEGDTC